MDWLVYVLIRVFICVVQSDPIGICHTISQGLAYVGRDVVRLRERVSKTISVMFFRIGMTLAASASFAECGSICF